MSTELPPLTGAQKSRLRGLGQTLPDHIELGRDGITPAFLAEFNRLLGARELVKLRFTGGQDRHVRADLGDAIAAAANALAVGAVGHTALFWRPPPDGSRLLGA
ncbi:MAG TPA: YhbY family RNA-binding protein [Candidatus Didemnitutus sp.]|nr:YhbY family RNA-binding protein [Candidatus Didemnitutus sp.]